MILVADSGSSKTDWIINFDNAEQVEFTTKGINPFFINDREIARIFSTDPEIKKYADKAKEVYFFGEGCSNPDKREMVSNGLSQVFKNAFINVENDAVGSAYATCGNGEGFTCILGTGSNIAFFDGQEVHYSKHGLGFILGDEGSGSWYGKKLIISFLQRKMPPSLRKDFKASYYIDREVVIKNVYQRPLPNIWLASFTPFLSRHRSVSFTETLIEDGMESFVRSHIMPYADYRRYPCHFVGSIAWHFRDVLEKVCKKHHIKVGKILSHPIKELSDYILKERVEA
ncbi:N-acetylglucosamine kinase [Pararcticibacter amylolyticus]|uniref:N-acetylglucosamine kinase n=1 Tax=Pararcticibacter amylolyticus TaxID=2173175 RepID=A0A2U2PIC9_9SPHI|nr:N-acetylglucosamine kinase [Pararcticibacter amylolyticus]PWG81022.1 N-acetylglucosamine kinase [Pararcticibacter amylolyticus]